MNITERAQQIIEAQPFSQLIGAEIEVFEAGEAVISLTLDEKLTQHMGFAHGGVLATLADMALTFAGGSVLGNVLTSELKINYLRPGMGDRLVARAKVIGHGRKQAVTRCEIFGVKDGEEKLCAAAQGTIVAIDGWAATLSAGPAPSGSHPCRSAP